MGKEKIKGESSVIFLSAFYKYIIYSRRKKLVLFKTIATE